MKRLQQLEPGLNAYKLNFDSFLLNTLSTMFDSNLRERLSREGYAYLFAGIEQINLQMKLDGLQFHLTFYGTAPLLWISYNNVYTYNLFRSFMTELDIMDEIKALVDFENHIVVYCDFCVVAKAMPRETWHKDYVDGANTYRLMTPLFELDKLHGQLMYKDETLSTNIYEYKMGEAIIFGDGFEHATQPHPETDALTVMLSFTFATDKA